MIANDETQLKRQEILRALDLEIEQIQKDTDRPGWTVWAILAALATSLWLLLQVIENSEFNLQVGLFAFLTISVLVDSLKFFYLLSKPEATRATNPKRFKLTTEFSDKRHLLFLSALRSGLLLYLGFVFSDWMDSGLASKLTSKIFYAYHGGYIFFLFLTLLLSFAKIPMILGIITPRANKLEKIRYTLSHVIINIGLIILTVGFLKIFYENFSIIEVPAFRFGGLLWVIGFLIMKLGVGTLKPTLLESLIEIRRDLLLEKIDLASASKQFDIALSGLEVSDLLQDEIREILQIYDQISKGYKIANEDLKTAKNIFDKKDSMIFGKDDVKLARLLLDSVELHQKKITHTVDIFSEKALKHAKHIQRLLFFYPHLEDKLNAPKNALLEIVDTLKKESADFSGQFKDFRQQLSKIEAEKNDAS